MADQLHLFFPKVIYRFTSICFVFHKKVTSGNFKNIFLYKSYISDDTGVLKRTGLLAFRILTKYLSSKDNAKLNKVQEQAEDLFQERPFPVSKDIPSPWLKEIPGW